MPDNAFEFPMAAPQRYRLEVPPDASSEDVIKLINGLQVTVFTDEGEAFVYRRFGPSAVYFRRLKTEEA